MNKRRLGSISMGHMALDVMAGSIAVILTAVEGQFELSDSQIGLGVLLAMCTSSLTQPFFGALADRLRGRWMGPVGLLWYTIFFAMVPLAPSYPVLLGILMAAGLGSAAVHTVGMVIAPDAGGDQPTTATSIFFLFGQTGLALAPVIAGFVIKYVGLIGLPLVALLMTPVVIAMFSYLRDPVAYEETSEPQAGDYRPIPATSTPATSTPATSTPATSTPATSTVGSIGIVVISVFLLLVMLRSSTYAAYMTFLPKYLKDLGYDSAAYGAMTGIFTFGGALGTLVGGWFGDRYSRRMVIFVSLILSVPFCYLLLGSSGWIFGLSAAIAGAFLNMSHSIMIILGQALLPQQKGMMSGVTLGFTFASGAFVAWLAGLVADSVGLPVVMYVLAGLPIAAAFVALLLPKTRESKALQPIPTPAGD